MHSFYNATANSTRPKEARATSAREEAETTFEGDLTGDLTGVKPPDAGPVVGVIEGEDGVPLT